MQKSSTIGAGTQGEGLSKKSLAKPTVSGKGSAFKQFENFLQEKGHRAYDDPFWLSEDGAKEEFFCDVDLLDLFAEWALEQTQRVWSENLQCYTTEFYKAGTVGQYVGAVKDTFANKWPQNEIWADAEDTGRAWYTKMRKNIDKVWKRRTLNNGHMFEVHQTPCGNDEIRNICTALLEQGRDGGRIELVEKRAVLATDSYFAGRTAEATRPKSRTPTLSTC